jgi:hypothetical protein
LGCNEPRQAFIPVWLLTYPAAPGEGEGEDMEVRCRFQLSL